MKMDVAILEGAPLLWATCRALGIDPVVAESGICYKAKDDTWVYPNFTNDSEVGALMSAHWISVERPSHGQTPPRWRAVTESKMPKRPFIFNGVVSVYGETLGVAVCRAIVLSYLGNNVDIPIMSGNCFV